VSGADKLASGKKRDLAAPVPLARRDLASSYFGMCWKQLGRGENRLHWFVRRRANAGRFDTVRADLTAGRHGEGRLEP
jgi:hypothetical protein